MKLILATALAALAVGCTATSDSTLANEDAIVSTDETDPEVLVFGSHAEALTWFEGMKPSLAAIIGPPATATAVSGDDPRTQRIKGLVATHWETIRTRFGVKLPLPQPIVVESPVSNAFVMYDPRVAKPVNAILVLTPILTMSDAELDAILVHELAHIVQKHVVPGAATEVERFYETGAAEELGILATDDAVVRDTVQPFISAATQVGGFTVPELRDIPGVPANLAIHLMLSAQQGLQATPPNPACRSLLESQGALLRTLGAATTFDKRVVPNDAQKSELTAAVEGIHTHAPSCMTLSSKIDFPTAAANQLAPFAGVDAATLKGQLVGVFGADASVFENKNALDGIYAMTTLLRGRIETTMAAPNFEKLRRYTTEEEADDFAMTVLHLDGHDASVMGKGVLKLAPEPLRAACEAFVATGAVPHYDLSALHHSECYRRYHSTQFATWLAQGGEGVKGEAAPRVIHNRRAFDPTNDRIAID